MALKILLEECIGCGGCESTCPTGAIQQGDGFPVLYGVDPLRCNDCNQCLTVCPVDGIAADPEWAICHGRGCPLASARLEGVACSEGGASCPDCGAMVWQRPGEAWACPTCSAAPGIHVASCPKAKKARRLRSA